jgi:hypothetical protein|mmetsp:Transcript_36791/g.58938  ORF Transcript_36791/g.58938 Transcript_36791/m.58938 type:complete len:319 (+) Transcript_36791:52-1008(+)
MVAVQALSTEEGVPRGFNDLLCGSALSMSGQSFSQEELDKLCVVQRKSEQSLSQEELDKLCVDNEGSESSSDDDALLRVRRSRAKQVGGLSQAELDSMCIDCSDDDSEDCFCSADTLQNHLDALSVTEDGACETVAPILSEALLLRVRRSRCFLGAKSTDVLFSSVMPKLPKDDVEEATTASGSLSPPSEPRRCSSGLSQETLDALCTACEDTDEPNSPTGLDSLLVQVRRKRFYLGDDSANSFAEDAMAETSGKELAQEEPVVVSDASECHTGGHMPVKGKPVDLCIDCCEVVDVRVDQIPSPLRNAMKRRPSLDVA